MSDLTKIPTHLGMIMDGNRRFSKKLMMKPWKGHEWGAKKLEDVMKWCQEFGIKELTLYTFSIQNFNRPKEEFDYLMQLFEKEFKRISEDEKRLSEEGLRIRFIGRREMFPETVRKMMEELEEKTKDNDKYFINFAMGYGGREEVVDAVAKIAKKVSSGEISPEKIDENVIEEYLYLKSQPDLIIRTGGDRRTSNFLIWQSNYSEWFFVDKNWPELEKEDFVKILEDYSSRERRFGK